MEFFDEKKNIRLELVNKEAENFASTFCTEKITSAQLRRFYNDFKALERKWQTINQNITNEDEKKNNFNKILPFIKMAKPKVLYAQARKTVPFSFSKWLDDAITSINKYEEFEAFLLHFEAVVGFAYGKGLKDSN